MHLKAIQIKERLLGTEDYEVALSVGHLASLYNYDMNKFSDAEQLYLRSIAIGESFSILHSLVACLMNLQCEYLLRKEGEHDPSGKP